MLFWISVSSEPGNVHVFHVNTWTNVFALPAGVLFVFE